MYATRIPAIVVIAGALAVASHDSHAAPVAAPSWLLTLSPSPIARAGHALTYDAARDQRGS